MRSGNHLVKQRRPSTAVVLIYVFHTQNYRLLTIFLWALMAKWEWIKEATMWLLYAFSFSNISLIWHKDRRFLAGLAVTWGQLSVLRRTSNELLQVEALILVQILAVAWQRLHSPSVCINKATKLSPFKASEPKDWRQFSGSFLRDFEISRCV